MVLHIPTFAYVYFSFPCERPLALFMLLFSVVTQLALSVRVQDISEPWLSFSQHESESVAGNTPLTERGMMAGNGETVAQTRRGGDIREKDGFSSLLANSVQAMPRVGERAVGGRVVGEIIIRQPEERRDRTTPVRAWAKDACAVVNMVGANSEPSRLGCFDVTDLICDHPRSYCMRSSDQCFAGSVQVPRGMKVTMYNLMSDWTNVCEADKKIVVEDSRSNRTGDITFWKYGYQDPRHRVCSFKFEKLPGWSCEGSNDKTHGPQGAQKRAGANANRDPNANVNTPSESHGASPSPPRPSDADSGVLEEQDSEADGPPPSPKVAAISKHGSFQKSPNRNLYYNIDGDVIFVEPPTSDSEPIAEYQEDDPRQANTFDHTSIYQDSSEVDGSATGRSLFHDIPQDVTDFGKSMLSYQDVNRIMPISTQVIEERSAHDVGYRQDHQARVPELRVGAQLLQSPGRSLGQSRIPLVSSRNRLVHANSSTRTRTTFNRNFEHHHGGTGDSAIITGGVSRG